jgi:hypothetical protein
VRRSWFAVILVASALTALGGLAGCGWVGAHDRQAKPNGFLLHGYVTTVAPCSAAPKDVYTGADVKIADENGKTLADGLLGAGVVDGNQCNFPFDIQNVPGASESVVVLIGALPAAKFPTSEMREGKPAVLTATPTPAPTASSSPS